MRTHHLVALAAISLCFALVGATRGDDAGITVSGTGEVKSKPTSVEFDLHTAGSGELTGDAIVKYKDAKRRVLEAYTKLKLKNLVIEEKSIAVATQGGAGNPNMIQFAGQPQAAAKPQVEISRTIRLSLKGIQDAQEEDLMETIGKILDTARDAGAAVGPVNDTSSIMARMYGQMPSASMCTFVLDNSAELREKAYQDAIEQARKRAERLASLAGVKLGSVVSVQESGAVSSDDSNPQQAMIMAMYGIKGGGEKDPRVTSDKFGEVPVRVNLQVRFAIEK